MSHEQALALAEAWLRRVTCARLNYGDWRRRGALRAEDLMPVPAKVSLKTNRPESIAGTADYVRPQTGTPEGFALLLDARAPPYLTAAASRVLDKAGFVQRGKGSEEGLIRFERVRWDHEGR